jgi:hypothetical protein
MRAEQMGRVTRWILAIGVAAGFCVGSPGPQPPLFGCRVARPDCVCDFSGMNCHWEWVCVR